MPISKRLISFAGIGILVLLTGILMQAAGVEADYVLYNGKILTANSEDPANFAIAEAVAIYDGKFVAVGGNREVLEFAGTGTRRIDLGGRTVLPGLIETHLHVHTMVASHHLGFNKAERTDPPVRWTSKKDGLAQLQGIATPKKPGVWTVVQVITPGAYGAVMKDAPTLAELDDAVPNHPVVLMIGQHAPALVNGQALKVLLDRYPKGMPGIVKDRDGNPTGLLKDVPAFVIREFWPTLSLQTVEELAPFYKKELEEAAARGLATVSTRLDENSLRVYLLLDQRKEMPVRMAYGHEMAAYHPLSDMIFHRVPGIGGYGSSWLWLAGATAGNIEGGRGPENGDACIHGEYPREAVNFPIWLEQPFGPHGECRLTGDPDNTVLRDHFLAAARTGWPVTNIHINGDRGLDDYMDVLEEAEKKYQVPVAKLRWSADHCGYISEEQARRAKRLGMTFTCSFPSPLSNAEKEILGAYTIIYGSKERAADSVVPFRRLIDHGLKPSAHCEFHQGWAFSCMQYAITRKDKATGEVWGPQQRINRREALYLYTRWAAWHIWKEDELGSIEKGKWADLVVIDRDYLTVPEDEIAQISPMLTIVGGKVSFSEPKFASSVSLPTVGFQASPNWWQR